MNTIVKEIHESYSGAEQQLVTEARKILEREKNRDEDKMQKLSNLGFSKAKPVVGLTPEELEQAQSIMFLSKKYSVIAPQYKFITDEKIDEINMKYGLVLAPASAFIEDIPERNQDDIVNFDFAERAGYEQGYNPYGHLTWKTKDGRMLRIREMDDDHISNTYAMIMRKYAYTPQRKVENRRLSDLGGLASSRSDYEHAYRGEWNPNSRSRGGNAFLNMSKYEMQRMIALYLEMKVRGVSDDDITNPSNIINISQMALKRAIMCKMYIAADKNSLDLDQHELIEGNRTVPAEIENSIKTQHSKNQRKLLEIYDPIVLSKVRGGWLIVTAWGLEGQDPEVHNPNRN